MHPYTAQWLAENRMAEAQRTADHARRIQPVRPRGLARRRHATRNVVGGWLVATGARLREPPPAARRV